MHTRSASISIQMSVGVCVCAFVYTTCEQLTYAFIMYVHTHLGQVYVC